MGYSPWGHKELDTTEEAHVKHPMTILWVNESLNKVLTFSTNDDLLYPYQLIIPYSRTPYYQQLQSSVISTLTISALTEIPTLSFYFFNYFF